MGVVNYYGTRGEILGDTSSGDYMRDALGSVTATISPSNGTLRNTYRYKPYGTQLATTGASATPKYRWVGTAGYRQTSLSHSASYVRARHAGNEDGVWTTIDFYWPTLPPYSYAWGDPVTVTDPKGKAPKFTITAKGSGPGECGASVVDWLIKIESKSYNGVLVQKITRTYNSQNCPKGAKAPVSTKCKPTTGNTLTYYEAWPIRNGRPVGVKAGAVFDTWRTESQGMCSHGSIKIEGLAKIVDAVDDSYEQGKVPCALDLFSTYKDPGWSNSGAQYRGVVVKWGCCPLEPGCKPPKYTKCPKPKKGCQPGPCFDTTLDGI